MNNPENLRMQLIDAINNHLKGKIHAVGIGGEAIFDEALWPVLQAAMKAGELLVARNTSPQIPVAKAIQTCLEGFVMVVGNVREDEKTISKAKLLKILFDMEQIAQRALTDAKALPF